MLNNFEIAGIAIPRGTKSFGELSIQDDDTGTIRLLIGVINGVEDGPVLCITAGMYGVQYPSIDACIRAYNEIDPRKLRGTVITMPVMHVPAFQKGMDNSPIDGLSLNSVFPGDLDGTITHRIAYTIFYNVIKRSQYHLDLRGPLVGWEGMALLPRSGEIGKKNFDASNEELVKVFGAKYYTVTPDIKGCLISEACREGIHSLIHLCGRRLASYGEDDIKAGLHGVFNLLKHLKMIDGEPDIQYKSKKLEYKMNYISAKFGGMLYLNAKCDDIVSKGEKLGEIRNLMGEVLQEIIAIEDGIVFDIWWGHIKSPGETIMSIRRILCNSVR